MAKVYDLARVGDPRMAHLEDELCPIPPPQPCEFSCVVDERGVHSVFWAGQPLTRWGRETVNTKLRKDHPAAFHGDLGIQTLAGVTAVEAFDIQFLDSYCLNHKNK
jgi:hypothetical protein